MRISGREADEREAAARDGSRVAWFGSYVIGEEKITVHPGGRWWRGDELELAAEAPSTMRGQEVEEPRHWFGSYELGEPGR
jgi:hypothetical protein